MIKNHHYITLKASEQTAICNFITDKHLTPKHMKVSKMGVEEYYTINDNVYVLIYTKTQIPTVFLYI